MQYFSCEMFTPLNAKFIYLGRSLSLWDEAHFIGVALAMGRGVALAKTEVEGEA